MGSDPPHAQPTGDDRCDPPRQRKAPGLTRLLASLPRGGSLPPESWRARHRVILVLLWAHVPVLVLFGIYGGHDGIVSRAYFESFGVAQSLIEGGVIALFAVAAGFGRLSRRLRSVAASLGLVTCSAVLTQFSGGFIEAHFHFFVMLGVIAMYLDWIPFLLAIGYVAVHHGTVGTFDPAAVYNHPAAIAAPWRWAFIHAFFVLGLSVAQIAHWRLAENARARTETVLEVAAEAILGVDGDGRVTFINPAAAGMLGLGRDEALQVDFGRLVHLEGADGDSGPLATLHDGTPRAAAHDTLVRADGDRVPVSWTSRPVQERDVSLGAVVTLRDMTQQQRAEEERRRQQQTLHELAQLREQDAFKTRFINTAAHELNTPLTPVNIQMRLLRRSGNGNLNAKQQEALDVLDRNIRRFGRLVEDLLDAARFQGGRLGFAPQPVDLGRDIIDEAAASFRGVAQEAGLHLDADSDEGLVAPVDPQRITQVLYNLVNNAVKFTAHGGSIRITARRRGGHAIMRVEDSGTGLDRAQIARLFQPFSQVHHDGQDVRQGTGLGLYLSRAIVELHGGRIWCESDGPGRGCSFCFELPLAETAQASAAASASSLASE